MPKTKLVKCPRCRRTVPADSLRRHIAEHKGKKLSFDTKFQVSTITNLDGKIMAIPDFQDFFNKTVGSKPQKSNLSELQIRELFITALNDVGTEYKSLILQPTTEPQLLEVVIDTNRDLVLKYGTVALKTVSEDGIRALLLHEACHVSTLPNSLVYIVETGDEQGMAFQRDNVTNYDEYLAHIEFVTKFRDDPRFKALLEQQYELTKNFEIIAKCAKVLASKLQRPTKKIDWNFREQTNSIVYDSLFFHVSGDPAMSKWFTEQSLEGLWVYSKWIHEDFEFIRKLALPLKDSHYLANISGTLGMSVNPYMLLLYNKICFADSTKQFHERMASKGQAVNLVNLWEQRRQAYS